MTWLKMTIWESWEYWLSKITVGEAILIHLAVIALYVVIVIRNTRNKTEPK